MNLFGITSVIIFFCALGFGITIYATNRKSEVNRSWLILSTVIAFWGLGLYGVTSTESRDTAMLWQYLLDISAIFIPVAFLYFILNLLKSGNRLLLQYSFYFACLLALFSVTSYFKTGMIMRYDFYWINPGPLYIAFPVFFLAIVAVSIFLLMKAYANSADKIFKAQIRNTFIAGIIGFGGGLTDFFPQVINIYPFGNYFVILYVVFMSYGVLKYKLLSAKVISAQLFAGAMSLVFLFNLLQSGGSFQDWMIKFLMLILVIIFSVLLVQSVYREVSQRERIEKLARELEAANKGQREFLHFLSHEVKGQFTVTSALFDSILSDSDYGPVSEKLRSLVETGLARNRKAVVDIEDILVSADLKNGAVKYDMQAVDFKEAITELVKEVKPEADDKGITLQVSVDENQDYTVSADKRHLIGHAIRNLVENAVIYTQKGEVMITLSRRGDKISLAVADSGVGLTPDDKARLFTEGGRGAESGKVNAHSTGHGLYIAKQIIEAHKGRVWAESEGRGKGSIFFAELPCGQEK